MLSFAGEAPVRAGVGEGDGFCPGANLALVVRKEPLVSRLAAPLAITKELNDRPNAQATAHVLIATDVKR